jgi:hypothetical protein
MAFDLLLPRVKYADFPQSKKKCHVLALHNFATISFIYQSKLSRTHFLTSTSPAIHPFFPITRHSLSLGIHQSSMPLTSLLQSLQARIIPCLVVLNFYFFYHPSATNFNRYFFSGKFLKVESILHFFITTPTKLTFLPDMCNMYSSSWPN